MRTLLLPLVAVGVIFYAHTDEPTENQMRSAFERSLAAEVADAMAFVGESGGREAVERVRMAGNDRFEIRNFRKVDCQPMATKSGFYCAFTANIILVNGPMQRSLKGRFYNAPEGMQFALDAESPDRAFPNAVVSTHREYIESQALFKDANNFNGE
jgi:hypothetical protein